MIIKNLDLLNNLNLFLACIVHAFPVNSSIKEILRTTQGSLSLIILLLPIFQGLKSAIHSRKEVKNLAILYSASRQGPTNSNVVSRISSFSLV